MNTLFVKFLSSEKYAKYTPYFKWLKYVFNRYFIFGFSFVIWMIFFDQNSLFTHLELNKQIANLENDESYFRSNLEAENKKLKVLTENPAEIERIAREKFYLKKDNEDIFIIQQEIQKKPLENETNE